MYSLTEIYKIGRGPSSSHTMGSESVCRTFMERYPEIGLKVILYGSLAKTGKGHGTDRVIRKTVAPLACEVLFDTDKADILHPNTMDIMEFKNGVEVARLRGISVCGGSVDYPCLRRSIAKAPLAVFRNIAGRTRFAYGNTQSRWKERLFGSIWSVYGTR